MYAELIELLPEENNKDDKEDDECLEEKSGNNNDHDGEVIKRCRGNALSYNSFYWNYMKKNWPIVLTETSIDWECRRSWTLNDKNDNFVRHENGDQDQYSDINFDYLKKKIGNVRCPVADCGSTYFNSHGKIEMNFNDFIEHWKSVRTTQSPCTESVVSSNNNNNNNNKEILPTVKNLYLKDWHLKAQMPDYDFYHVPKQFASDWLNEHLVSSNSDDYRFVYMGPKNTWTPFHADVFGSFSWSTNIVGTKKWLLLKPGEELKLSDRFGNLPFAIDEALLESKSIKYFTLLQGENESIFVPSGWYHQVTNLTDTISINHNWLNACNIHQIWNNLVTNMKKVIAEIEDCRQMDDFSGHCQKLLLATFGMNYNDFLNLLESIIKRRLNAYNHYLANGNVPSEDNTNLILFDIYKFNDFHLKYDLLSIRNVLQNMYEEQHLKDNYKVLHKRCEFLMNSIQIT